jgi:hypothetical protein
MRAAQLTKATHTAEPLFIPGTSHNEQRQPIKLLLREHKVSLHNASQKLSCGENRLTAIHIVTTHMFLQALFTTHHTECLQN